MDQQFSVIEDRPDNQIFRVVFYPDRIYHAAYLNATVSKRYHYNVSEVRTKHDITIIKAQVFQDGQFLANVLRIEYLATRLGEVARESGRFLQSTVKGFLRVRLPDGSTIDNMLSLDFCNWVRAFQCEIWDNLEPVTGASHHYKVLSQMGKNGSIIELPNLNNALKNLKALREIEVFFVEADVDHPFGYTINNPAIDNDYLRSYQVPNNPAPNSPENTVNVHNYLFNFQRGWFLDTKDVQPVRYENAMMESINPFFRPTPANPSEANIVEMRWILQRELGGRIVYFHHVTVKPNSFEGIHQHIGSEELYYITSGEGIAYMGENDDPLLANEEIVGREIFCLGEKPVRRLKVSPGKVIFTKSGGIHGIQNESPDTDLTFVAFGYHSS